MDSPDIGKNGVETADMTTDTLTDASLNSLKLDALGVLAGGIAHDFNNLLGGIYGYIDLAMICAGERERSTYLSKAIATIDRARSLTRQLLTFSKGGAPVRKITQLFPYLRESIDFTLSKSSVHCIFDVPETLWPCNIDLHQIEQAVVNIIANAEQAMSSGGTIEVRASNIHHDENGNPLLRTGNYLKLSIRDNGPGIPKHILPRIFDPFFTTREKGHGLGLALCHSIINRHGGCIEVESEPEKGCTFHIYLPASAESVPPLASVYPHPVKKGGTILVMDDDEVIREIMRDMLESLGYSVLSAANGNETLSYFVSSAVANSISAVILDMTVHDRTVGRETAEAIRKVNPGIPIFVASGYAQDPVVTDPVKFGFTASIVKPFRIDDLSGLFDRYLQP